MIEITFESIVQRKDDQILANEIDDEMVMMNLESGNYISLNKVGSIIWQQLEKPIQVNDLIEYLMGRYNVQKEECVTDTLQFLQKIQEQNALTVIKTHLDPDSSF